jgi:hypothetical protein
LPLIHNHLPDKPDLRCACSSQSCLSPVSGRIFLTEALGCADGFDISTTNSDDIWRCVGIKASVLVSDSASDLYSAAEFWALTLSDSNVAYINEGVGSDSTFYSAADASVTFCSVQVSSSSTLGCPFTEVPL